MKNAENGLTYDDWMDPSLRNLNPRGSRVIDFAVSTQVGSDLSLGNGLMLEK